MKTRIKHAALWTTLLALLAFLSLACSGKSKEVPPPPKPVLSLAKATFNIQEKIKISLVDGHEPPHDTDWIGLYEEGATPGATSPAIWRGYLKDLGLLWSWGIVSFDPALIPADQKSRYSGNQAYKFILAYDDSSTVAARTASFGTVAPAALTMPSTKVDITETLTVTLANGNNPPGATDWIAIYPADAGPDAYLWYGYLKDLGITSANGTFTIDPSKISGYLPGASYTIALLYNDSYKVEASLTFSTKPSLKLTSTLIGITDTVQVTLGGGHNPPHATDWIGLYEADVPVGGNPPAMWYGYLKADLGISTGDGTFTFDPAQIDASAKARYISGKSYKLILAYDDSYTMETSATFTLK